MKEVNEKVNDVLVNIRQERVKQNLSQVQVATKAEIAQSFYSGIESMQNIPTLTTLFKIADALNIPASKLLEEKDINKEEVKNKIIQMIRDEL